MKAVVGEALGPFENFQLRDWECPAPAAGEVQVDVHAAGVTFVDALIAGGRHQVQVKLPFIPGNEVSGVVVAAGPGVKGFRAGDKVSCVGVGGKYAQRINVPRHAALRMPEAMPFDEAAVFRGSFECSYHALVQGANVQPGEKVLVLGAAGAIGQAAVQIARALGARVLASASSSVKREQAMRAGAEAAVDTNADDWRAQVREWAGASGIDVVVDPVGGAATERAFRAMGLGGRHLVIGFAAGSIPALPVNLALLKAASLVGVELSKFEQRFPQLASSNSQALLNLYARGAISGPAIAHRFRFDQFRDALSLAASGASAGSIVLQVQHP
jgi:NADPH2:quinone reductase